MYARQLAESRRLQVKDLAAEQAAIDEGFFEVDDLGEQVTAPTAVYPKRYHPGYPTGAAHGMLVKD